MKESDFSKELHKRYKELSSTEIQAEYSLEEMADAVGGSELAAALFSGKRIRKCKCCGRPFITSGVGNECYCDRLYEGGRTCKEFGPVKTRNKDVITREMDKARRLHLWRRARAGKTDEACTKYKEWLLYAQANEKRCRNGEMTIEELKDTIGTGYLADKDWGAGYDI